jgi:hypothetical protein
MAISARAVPAAILIAAEPAEGLVERTAFHYPLENLQG